MCAYLEGEELTEAMANDQYEAIVEATETDFIAEEYDGNFMSFLADFMGDFSKDEDMQADEVNTMQARDGWPKLEAMVLIQHGAAARDLMAMRLKRASLTNHRTTPEDEALYRHYGHEFA